jgi:FlaA1/EpsC-like NDP-sugar epimerase
MHSRFHLPLKARVTLLHDICAAGIAFILALYLCMEDLFWFIEIDRLVIDTVLLMAVSAFTFFIFGLYRGLWRYASLNEMFVILASATFSIPVFVCLLFFLGRLGYYSRLSYVVEWFILLAFLSGPRLLYRSLKDNGFLRTKTKFDTDRQAIPVLLLGIGDAAELFIREMTRSDNAAYRVVGVLSNKKSRVGYQIRGVRVLDMLDQLLVVCNILKTENKAPQRLIIADEALTGHQLLPILEDAEKLGLPISRLPRVTDFQSGPIDERMIKPIAIEDLLGRSQNVIDRTRLEGFISGKRILITGAGGSIGSELVRQVCQYNPHTITLLDNSEYLLYEIESELNKNFLDINYSVKLGDVRDERRLKAIFRECKPDIVFHAAALKHVPLLEGQAIEAIMTNVIGTRNVAELCREFYVDTMVMISTDKAVNPTNIMGTTKRFAESYCQALDQERHAEDHPTKFVTVRFGNVLGSRGSVVPLFQKQLAQGGPLTITHPEVIRYFMTIREAVELVLQSMVIGGDAHFSEGKLFVLDMGAPVKIVDLAHQMIKLAGLKPDEDIKIEFTGLRPGEKLYEELFYGEEALVETESKGIMLASPQVSDYLLIRRALQEIEERCLRNDEEGAVAILTRQVPEYQCSVTVNLKNG